MTEQCVDLLGLPHAEMARWLDEIGVGATHSSRVFRALHKTKQPLEAVTGLGPRHSARIGANSHRAVADVVDVLESPDGTRKLVIALADEARVEAVIIPMREDRATLCLSTQVGCAMACRFCATGTLGLTRHLTAGEVVAQVHAAQAILAGSPHQLRNLVYMGMGEPLHAYEATSASLRVLLDPGGAAFAYRHVTVSTVGLPKQIAAFSADFGGRVQFALSLHAGTDATREAIIPSANRWPLASLRRALLDMPLPGHRQLMLEYVVLPGINDTAQELDAVVDFVQGMSVIINLIPFNPFPQGPYRSPTDEEVLAVYDHFQANQVAASIRWPRGRGAAGACGQLALATGEALGEVPSKRSASPKRFQAGKRIT